MKQDTAAAYKATCLYSIFKYAKLIQSFNVIKLFKLNELLYPATCTID